MLARPRSHEPLPADTLPGSRQRSLEHFQTDPYVTLRAPSLLELSRWDEGPKEQTFDLWRAFLSRGFISYELYLAIIDSVEPLPRLGSQPIPLATLLREVGRSETGQALLLSCFEQCPSLQFFSARGALVSQEAPHEGLFPLWLSSKVEPWSDFIPELRSLNSRGFQQWLSVAINGTTEESRELKRELGKSKLAPCLSLCSYNVWGTKGVLGVDHIVKFSGRAPVRFGQIGEELRASHFDIVTLQEMWAEETERIIEVSRYPFVGRASPGTGMWQKPGLVTLSRFPILDTKFMPFKGRGGHERYVKKGALLTRLECPDNTILDVYNTHLISPAEKLPVIGSSERLHKIFGDPSIESVRLGQIDELRLFINENSSPQGFPYVVMGDFNSPEGSREYQKVRNEIGIDTFRTRMPLGKEGNNSADPERIGLTYDIHTNKWGHGRDESSARLDYIFFSPELAHQCACSVKRAFDGPTTTLSDHFAVTTEFIRLDVGQDRMHRLRGDLFFPRSEVAA